MAERRVPSDEQERAAGRRWWPMLRYRLGNEVGEDLGSTTSPRQRLAMMWELAARAWRLSGRELPSYPRSRSPGRLLRRRGAG